MKITSGLLISGAIFFPYCLSLIFTLRAGCQTREISFASPEDAAHVSENCFAGSCDQLTKALHLSTPLRPGVCSVAALRGSFEPRSKDALLKIECSQDFELLLLTQESGRWSYADSLPLPWGAHDIITLKLQKVIDPNDEAIVIDDDTVGFGTGVYQADFKVVRVSNGKLHVVLDTVEKGSIYPPQSDGTKMWVTQRSSFKIASATENGPGSINERMTLNVGGKRVILEREFDWQEDLGIFQPGYWYSSDAAAEGKGKKSG